MLWLINFNITTYFSTCVNKATEIDMKGIVAKH